MATGKLTFYKCLQDAQVYGDNDEEMVSILYFNLEIGDKKYDLNATIKQSVGSNYEDGAIEVGRPIEYKGPFNYHVFRDAAEKYYRSLFGSSGTVVRFQKGAVVRMKDNLIVKEMVFEFEVTEGTGGW